MGNGDAPLEDVQAGVTHSYGRHDGNPIDAATPAPEYPIGFSPPVRRTSSFVTRNAEDALLPPLSRTIDSDPGGDSFSVIDSSNLAESSRSQAQQSHLIPSSKRPYKCLETILPLLQGIVNVGESCELLEFYFAQPGSSLFRSGSPYVLTQVLRKRSLLDPISPRRTSPALLCTILWVSAQTADIPLLLLPGERTKVCESLRKLSMRLIQKRDTDHRERLPDGRLVDDSSNSASPQKMDLRSIMTPDDELPQQTIDDVLTFILVCIVLSGSDFKRDCQMWWNKALRLMYAMGLNRKDMRCDSSPAACITPSCTCREAFAQNESLRSLETHEESRRVFWLLFCLDRHLALSYNSTLCIGDDECEVFIPLPEDVWNSLENAPVELLTHRTHGPPTIVTGTGLFEWFLPLMTILGDVIQIHHRRLHPRFGTLNDTDAVTLIEASLQTCAQSIRDVERRFETEGLDGTIPASEFLSPSSGYQETPYSQPFEDTMSHKPRGRAQAQLVTAYGTFILQVLHVLLHGKWDAVSMLENDDGWITSVQFMKCASHAIAASEAVSQILRCDPELTFTPYLFGIYLLHGSFILLLFADRMPQLGPNESVERACETIIRAHEVCVVTLSTEFQVSHIARLIDTILLPFDEVYANKPIETVSKSPPLYAIQCQKCGCHECRRK